MISEKKFNNKYVLPCCKDDFIDVEAFNCNMVLGISLDNS